MSNWVPALRLTGIGFFIGFSLLLGVAAGLWLDGKLNTRPVFMIIGVLAGLGVATYGAYKMLRPLMNGKPDKENS
jgi:ATP synthase protein I